MNNNEKRRQEIRDLLWSKSIELFWILVICSAVLVTILGMTAKARSQPLQAPPLPQAPPIIPEHIIPAVQLAQAPPIIEQPPVAPPSNGASATIRVTVNENALIWFDGVITSSTGAYREFVSPPIAGQGTYKLKLRHGARETIRDVTVRPGDDITIDLRNGSPRVTSSQVPLDKAIGNDCGCSFGGICRCGGLQQGCQCNGILPHAPKAPAGKTTGGISTERPPFVQSSGDQSSSGAAPLLIADRDPWLSREETEHIKARWPKGVVFPSNLRFYRLAPRYQAMTTMNNGRTKVNKVSDIHDEESHEFTVSGGMAAIDASKWKSVKGLAIPDGEKIAVWKEATEVRALSLVPRWRWRFPVKTVAYDVLFNSEWEPFEIRTREKGDEGWVPSVEYKNAKIAPDGYHGAGKSCNSCHVTAGRIMDVPGRIYRRERWGSDTVMSWRPFDEAGNLDYRWPI